MSNLEDEIAEVAPFANNGHDPVVDEPEPETVYLALGRTASNYHTDPDCQNVKKAEEIDEVELQTLGGWYKLCEICDPDVDHKTYRSSRKYYDFLKDADPEVLE